LFCSYVCRSILFTCLPFILHAAALCALAFVNPPASSFCACNPGPCVCLQGKRLDIVRSEVVLADLVGDVHCIIEAMIGRGGSVQLHPPQLHSVPDMVCCDPDRLRGVLLNLYTNAGELQGVLALGPGSNLLGLCEAMIRRLKLSL
jgi:hypothetical protein